MRTIVHDLRYGIRMLWKNPGFTIVAISALALGIGVNTALFTGFNLILRPKSIGNPESVVSLAYQGQRRGRAFSYPEYVHIRDSSQVFSDVVASFHEKFLIGETSPGIEPEEIEGDFVSQNYFATLGGTTMLGRLFDPEENSLPGRDAVVILSHRFWQQRFAHDGNIIGRTLLLNGKPFTVIGVTDAHFLGLSLETPDIWLPLMMRAEVPTVYFEDVPPADRDWLGGAEFQWLELNARLKPSRSLADARAEMPLLVAQLASTNRTVAPNDSIALAPISALKSNEIWLLMAMVLGASALVLLVACSNVANMLLARAAARQKEIGMRLCLGASRRRILRQLLTESLLLASIGGLGGLLISWWSLDLISGTLLARYGVRNASKLVLDLSPDWRVLIFSLFVSLLAALAFGLVPALRATRGDLISVIKDEASGAGGIGRSWLRGGFVVAQISLCLVLLVPAGLLLRGVKHLLSTDPGFEAKKLLEVSYSVELSGYDVQRARLFHDQLMARLAALPGVESVSQDSAFGGRATITLPARDGATGKQFGAAPFQWITADYLKTIGTPILRGRSFSSDEVAARAPVVMVSESTAAALWRGEEPVGQTMRIERLQRDGRTDLIFSSSTVVGVVRDNQSYRVGQIAPLFLYLPGGVTEWVDTGVLVRTSGDAVGMKQLVRSETLALEPVLRLSVDSFDELIGRDKSVMAARAASDLAGGLGGLAMILAAVGIYGVMSYSVAQRRREIGIRLAVGAEPHDVLGMVLGQGMKLVMIGVGIGGALSLLVAQILKSLLFGVSTVDPATFLGTASLVAAVALLACWMPAHRATRVDPMIALRCE